MNDFKADPILKDYLNKKNIFIDIINNIIYNGSSTININDIQDYDTDMSSVIDDKLLKGINRNHDIIYHTTINGAYMLISIENQSTVDKLMPLRVLMYDALCYQQQLRRYNSKSNKQFKLIPTHTIVMYYGDTDWNSPKSLLEMMEVPEGFKKRLNNWKIDVVLAKDLDYDKFKEKDNYNFFKYLQTLYNWNGDLNSLKDVVISRNVAILLAAVAGNKDILEIVKETKGDEINMCQSIDLFEARALNKGKINTILQLLQTKLHQLSPQTIHSVENCSSEQLDNLINNIFDINNEDEVNTLINQ